MEWRVEINRFWCSDRDGTHVEVVVQKRMSPTENGSAETATFYVTAGGEPLERLDDGRFRLPTGALLTRRTSPQGRR